MKVYGDVIEEISENATLLESFGAEADAEANSISLVISYIVLSNALGNQGRVCAAPET